ncbi:MAG: C1 family peptidase [Muribaculaceae bacterium]
MYKTPLQHSSHFFVGSAFTGLADSFARYIKRFADEESAAYFNFYSVTAADSGGVSIATADCDTLSPVVIDGADADNAYEHFFDSLFRDHVNVATPGTGSMLAVIYVPLYDAAAVETAKDLIRSIDADTCRYEISVMGVSHDLARLFLDTGADPLSTPQVLKANCALAIGDISAMRHTSPRIVSFRLLSDINADGLALNLDLDAMTEIFGRLAILETTCRRAISGTTAFASRNRPVDTFGLAAMIFDRNYFVGYLLRKATISVIDRAGISIKDVSINVANAHSQPVIERIRAELASFYDAKVRPLISSYNSDQEIIAKITGPLDSLFAESEDALLSCLKDKSLSFPEKEAIVAMILGYDSPLFKDATITPSQLSADDLATSSLNLFVKEDLENAKYLASIDPSGEPAETYRTLGDNTIEEIKQLRTKIRNTTRAIRMMSDNLTQLHKNVAENEIATGHISGDGFEFGGVVYRPVVGESDAEPFEEDYQPHPVSRASIDLRQRFTPVKSQGSLGSCSAFAVTSVIEYMIRQLTGDIRNMSEAFLYYNAREAVGKQNENCGTSIYRIIKEAMTAGICDESHHQYDETNFSAVPSDLAFSEAQKCLVVKAMNVKVETDAIKSAIADGYPVVISARIFDSFGNDRAGFVKMPTSDEISPREEFSHAMVICGYSDDYKVFVVRNSWGEDFGDGGYCYMPYRYAEEYLNYACIITELSLKASDKVRDRGCDIAVNFNTNDAAIQCAILENTIDEAQDELAGLNARYNTLKTAYATLEIKLANANVRTDIADAADKRLDRAIDDCRNEENSLMSQKAAELDANRVKGFKLMFYAFIFLLSCGCWIWLAEELNKANMIYTTVGSTAFIIAWMIHMILRRRIRVRYNTLISEKSLERSDLEIERKQKRLHLHLAGMIIDRLGRLSQTMTSCHSRLMSFNANLASWRKSELESEPAPTVDCNQFVDIIDDRCLDRYFADNAAEITSGIDLDSLFAEYTLDDGAINATKKKIRDSIDSSLRQAIADFSMLDYLIGSRRYDYLPEPATTGQLIPDISGRADIFAKPVFTDIDNDETVTMMFINAATPADAAAWRNATNAYFSITPMLVETDDPDRFVIYRSKRFSVEELLGR